MYERLITLIGDEKLKLLKTKKVLIVGLGGVGGYALEAIARSGIQDIHLIDRDVIELSNLNRQIITDENNIGKPKVEVAKKRITAINSNLKVTTFNINLDENNIEEILNNNYDYIIDACDTINTKLALIIHASKYKYKLISSMGTANKTNPALFSITNLNKTANDPIARILRKKVKELKIKDKIMVVSSTELVTPNKNLGTVSYIPGIAGLLSASYVINDIIK